MKPLLLTLAAAVALVAAGAGASAPPAVDATGSCSQVGSFFNVQIAGNKLGSYWLRLLSEAFAPIPSGKSMIVVWSFGSQTSRGPVVYGWITDTRSRLSSRCPARAARRPTGGTLGPPVGVKDGWAYGRRFACNHRGRFLIHTEKLRNGIRMTVWMEKSRELIAVAEVAPGFGWLRTSKRCVKRTV